MKKLILFVFINFIVGSLFAQTTVKGVIVDEQQAPLSAATVVLMQKSDSLLVSFGITDNAGSFLIKKVAPGDYILQVTYLGYENYSEPFNLPNLPAKGTQAGGEKEKDFGNVLLEAASENLDEVVVAAEHIPIQMSNDTIIYNADAFKTREGAVVEDLLKKLPGIEVDREGNIKAQGEDVRKVYVDGKEFFGDDPKIATKNLPADAVDKVQVYDKPSDMAEFTGIDDGQEAKTINLELKDGKKKGYFGNVSAGYGTEDRFESKFNVNRFGKKAQLSAIGRANNVNEQGYSFNDYLSFMGGLGAMMGEGGEISIGSGDMPVDFGRGDGFTNSGSGGLNFNYDIGKKTDLHVSYFYSRMKTIRDRVAFRENLLGEKSFDSEEEELSTSKNAGHRINLNLKSEIDSFQQIRLRANTAFTDVLRESNLRSKTYDFDRVLENDANRVFSNDGNNTTLNATMIYRRRFRKKGRVISAEGAIGMQDQDRLGDLMSLTSFRPDDPILKTIDSLQQRQFNDGQQKDYRLQLTYTEPLSKKSFLQFRYGRRNYNNNSNREFFDVLGNEERLNELLSNRFNRDYFYDQSGLSLQHNEKNMNLTVAANWQHSQLGGTLASETQVPNQSFDFILPRLRYSYNFKPSRSLRFSYSTATREPTIEQLQPIVDNTNPLNTYIGNPDLVPEYQHKFNLNFHDFDQFNFTSFFASIRTTFTNNKITTAQSIDSLFRRTTTPLNVSKDWMTSASASFSMPIRPIKSKINLSGNLIYNQSLVYVNEIENQVDRVNGSFKLSIENRKKEKFDLLVGGRLAWNDTEFSVNAERNQRFFNPGFYSTLFIPIGERWEFNTDFDYAVYPATSFGERLEIPIWEASISCLVFKNKKGKISLSAFDLLNQNLGINRATNFNYIEEERVLSLGRYFMLGFSYALSGFGGDQGHGFEFKMMR